MSLHTVYCYDPATHLYTGETVAMDCPIQPGLILMPYASTSVAPPSVVTGKIAKWSGTAWSLIEIPAVSAPAVDSEVGTMEYLRTTRNALLTASDWTQLSDAPLDSEAKNSWQIYRQELRDLPEHTEDPANVEWPELPS
ncbi:MAG: tail fiber assembly protein [Verrucomicrobium sp.]|nr:tail fiber assembly protein [Verrucomicrobium sp.]